MADRISTPSGQISLSDRMRTNSVTHNTVLVEGDDGEDDYDEVSLFWNPARSEQCFGTLPDLSSVLEPCPI